MGVDGLGVDGLGVDGLGVDGLGVDGLGVTGEEGLGWSAAKDDKWLGKKPRFNCKGWERRYTMLFRS